VCSSDLKELARTFGATLVVLVTVVMTMTLIRTLGEATRGVFNPADVLIIMGYTVLSDLPTILSLSLFIAVVTVLTRMYRDSEMVVWFASGRGLTAFLRPLLRFAWPVLLLIAFSSLFVWPWTNQQTTEMKQRFEQRSDLDRIAPGQFQESSGGNRVFFIDSASEGRAGSNNIFIASTDKSKNAVTTAQSGHVQNTNGQQMLILQNGQRLENTVGKSELKISDFEEYGISMNKSGDLGPDAVEVRAISTRNLIKSNIKSHQGELSWRVGLVLGALNFVVMALALASVNPRAGRSSNLIFVLLTFVVYSNLLSLGQSWVTSGRVGFGTLLLVMHGSVLMASLAWLTKRNLNWTPRDLLPRRTKALVQP